MRPTKKARELTAYTDQSVLRPEFAQADIRGYIREGIDGMGIGCRSTPAVLGPTAEQAREERKGGY